MRVFFSTPSFVMMAVRITPPEPPSLVIARRRTEGREREREREREGEREGEDEQMDTCIICKPYLTYKVMAPCRYATDGA